MAQRDRTVSDRKSGCYGEVGCHGTHGYQNCRHGMSSVHQWIEDELLYPGIYQVSGLVVRCSCCKAVFVEWIRPCNSYSV